MRLSKHLLLLSASILILGCHRAEAPPPAAPEDPLSRLFAIPNDAATLDLEHRRLALLHLGYALYLGDTDARALEVFAPPIGATDLSDLPQGWDQERFQAKGWEKNPLGFCAILSQNQVALAQFTRQRVPTLEAESVVDQYVSGYGPGTTIDGGNVRYLFWDDGKQRLMLNIVTVPGQQDNVTEALGDATLMDALRMSVDDAKVDGAAFGPAKAPLPVTKP